MKKQEDCDRQNNKKSVKWSVVKIMLYFSSFYFLLFMIYSFLGWCIEMMERGIHYRRITNRGFLIGPYCPIYGYSAIIMIFLLTPFVTNNPIFTFLICSIICAIIEYGTSYAMEKIFQARWWDYSDRKFHINGMICLGNLIAFGMLSMILLNYLNPKIEQWLITINHTIMITIALILFIIYLLDTIVSFNIIYKIKSVKRNIKVDSTEEIKKIVRNIIFPKNLVKRLINAFPTLKFK